MSARYPLSAVILAVTFTGDRLDDQRFEVLRIVLAPAGGGIGGGFLDLNMKAGQKWTLRAGGGLAEFIVLYFWSAAHWVAMQPGSVNQRTSGANSPAINGNGTVVNGGRRDDEPEDRLPAGRTGLAGDR